MSDFVLIALLMRVWVAEAGWTAPRDHAAINGTLQKWVGVRGDTLQAVVRRMVDNHSGALDRSLWLLDLNSECDEPVGWPQKLRWSKYQPLCFALAHRAERALAGRLPDPCHGKADQWRAKRSKMKALRKALRKGYVRVHCGKTVNAFLKEPNLRAR